MIKKLTDFFNEKLWMMRSREFPFYLRLPLTCARVIVLTARRFIQNQCTVKASSLTFYTLFAIAGTGVRHCQRAGTGTDTG